MSKPLTRFQRLSNAKPPSSNIEPGSPATGSPAPDSPQAGLLPPVDGIHPALPPAAGSPVAGSPVADAPTLRLWSALPQSEGHLKLPNIIVDHLFQLLDLQERSVYLQLYRLSYGYGKATCKIGLPRLAERAGLGRSTVAMVVKRLVKKGLIAVIKREIGHIEEQGNVYWVSAPGSPSHGSPASGSPVPAPYKERIKENLIKGDAPRQRKDYSGCPDCNGTGFAFKDGDKSKGVVKCKHEKLSHQIIKHHI
jgi:hypothetical protein